jgi:transposase
MSAARFNPALKPFAVRLKAAGKPRKLVMIAVARKLLITANAVLKREIIWQKDWA